jgi:hypothetical protein
MVVFLRVSNGRAHLLVAHRVAIPLTAALGQTRPKLALPDLVRS